MTSCIIFILNKYYGDQIKDDEVDGTHSMHGSKEMYKMV